MNRTTEQLIHIIDMTLAHTPIVQIIVPPQPNTPKTQISQVLKERGNWVTPSMVSTKVLIDMTIRAPSMNLLINHYPRRELEIPYNFKRQIVFLGHQPIVITNRHCIVIEYKMPKEEQPARFVP